MADYNNNLDKTFEEYVKIYGFNDKKKIYTNGATLIPVFRVYDWIEHNMVIMCQKN